MHTESRDDLPENDKKLGEYFDIPAPQKDIFEQVYFHELASDSEGNTFLTFYNPEFEGSSPLGVVLRFNKNELPALTEWKLPEKGYYVVGFEPGTTTTIGRGPLHEKGELPYIEGESSYSITIDFEIIDSMETIKQLQNEADKITKSYTKR